LWLVAYTEVISHPVKRKKRKRIPRTVLSALMKPNGLLKNFVTTSPHSFFTTTGYK